MSIQSLENSKYIHPDIERTSNMISEMLNLLTENWKIPVVIKQYFKDFRNNDRDVEASTDDLTRHQLENLIYGVFIKKKNFLTEHDMYKIFDLLSYDTLNKAYLAWFDEMNDIREAKKVKNRNKNETYRFTTSHRVEKNYNNDL